MNNSRDTRHRLVTILCQASATTTVAPAIQAAPSVPTCAAPSTRPPFRDVREACPYPAPQASDGDGRHPPVGFPFRCAMAHRNRNRRGRDQKAPGRMG